VNAPARSLGRHCHVPVTERRSLADFRADCARRFGAAGSMEARTAFAQELAFVTDWARKIGAEDPAAVADRSVALSQIALDWGHALEALGDVDFAVAVEVRGETIQTESPRRGTIYATLAGLFTEAFPRWLDLRDGSTGLIIGLEQGRRTAWQHETRPLDLARELHAAQQVLRDGGHVHILVDGFQGHRGVLHEFFGYDRPFQPGFAELAARTNARIVPVMTDCSPSGRLTIDLLPALPDAAAAQAAGDGWREKMVGYAANFVSLQWRTRPHTVKWGHMRRFIEHSRQAVGPA